MQSDNVYLLALSRKPKRKVNECHWLLTHSNFLIALLAFLIYHHHDSESYNQHQPTFAYYFRMPYTMQKFSVSTRIILIYFKHDGNNTSFFVSIFWNIQICSSAILAKKNLFHEKNSIATKGIFAVFLKLKYEWCIQSISRTIINWNLNLA